MKFETITFITVSNLFEGLKELLEYFKDCEMNPSYGTNEYTLITADDVISILDGEDFDISDDEEENEELRNQYETLKKRLIEVRNNGAFIDLEHMF